MTTTSTPLTVVERALLHLAEGPCAAAQTNNPGFISTRHLSPLLKQGLAERFTNRDGYWRYRLTVAGLKQLKALA